MSMSTHVIGFRPPDEWWQAMKAVWDACHAAGVPTPREVDVFFEWTTPDPRGVLVPLLQAPNECARAWKDGDREGFEIDVARIPKDVTIIRFWNSW